MRQGARSLVMIGFIILFDASQSFMISVSYACRFYILTSFI